MTALRKYILVCLPNIDTVGCVVIFKVAGRFLCYVVCLILRVSSIAKTEVEKFYRFAYVMENLVVSYP